MNNKNIESIVDSLFLLLPLFKKKLLRPDKYDEENDLSPSHLQILFFLDDVGRVPISEIGKGLNISKPNMTPLIKKLINKKFVEKIRDQEDRRYVHVDITPIGKKFIDEHKLLISQRLKDKLSILNQKDLQKLSKSLDELKEIISKLD
ncbi:MAG: hypothetical protein PWQ37_1125 [Candidatus Petromonas sp.]|jgi:DNA-binding MarR family transcriptional regulator|nr:hypothetical protein [Candidatus Petromonas sp.]